MTPKARPGVETEEDALKSYSVKRMELMMKEDMLSFTIELSTPDSVSTSEHGVQGSVIGFIGITSPPEIFYIFDEQYWGKGYATEALRAFLDTYWATYPTGLPGVSNEIRHHLEAHVHEGNIASEKILAKMGFLKFGEAETGAHGGFTTETLFRIERPPAKT